MGQEELRYRQSRLDHNCELQRVERLLLNPKFRYRKKAVVSTFRHHLANGASKANAYRLALGTQLIGLKLWGWKTIKVDARTYWVNSNYRANP